MSLEGISKRNRDTSKSSQNGERYRCALDFWSTYIPTVRSGQRLGDVVGWDQILEQNTYLGVVGKDDETQDRDWSERFGGARVGRGRDSDICLAGQDSRSVGKYSYVNDTGCNGSTTYPVHVDNGY